MPTHQLMVYSSDVSRLRYLAAVAAVLAAGPSPLADTLHDHDNGPLTGYFGIPDSTESSVLLRPGAEQWSALVMTASHSISDDRNGESIILDGETTRLEFAYRRGITPAFELGIELPLLWHESGGLDSLVDNWHDWLGFPGGFRGKRPNDQLEYRYTDNAVTRIDYRTNQNGIGDLRLVAGWQVLDRPEHTMALRFGLKVPTGDGERLLGSGGTDISIGVAGDLSNVFGSPRLSAYYRASAIFIGEPDLLADRHNDVAGHLALGAGYTVTDTIELRLQAALRSPLYDSDIETLGDPAGTLTFGCNFRVSPKYVIGIGVSEDIKVRSAPDIAFQLSLRYRAD